MLNSKSGELLSAGIALAFSISLLTNTEQLLTKVMYDAGAMPEWAIVSVVCAIVTFLSAILKTEKIAALARFVSGALFGTVILLYIASEVYSAIFWVAVTLFVFDVYLVVSRGREWKKKVS